MWDSVKKSWYGLQPRERVVLGVGAVFVASLMLYSFIWQPWQNALSHMESVLPAKRTELIWMKEQEENLKAGLVAPTQVVKGQDLSLMAILERSAKTFSVRAAIKQLTPRQNGKEVSVVLESVSFNQWVRWIDDLQSSYGVKVVQLTAERETEKPDLAEVRMTVER